MSAQQKELLDAILACHATRVSIALETCDPNFFDDKGNSPLMYAADIDLRTHMKEKAFTIFALVLNKAKITACLPSLLNKQNEWGETILMRAARRGNYASVELGLKTAQAYLDHNAYRNQFKVTTNQAEYLGHREHLLKKSIGLGDNPALFKLVLERSKAVLSHEEFIAQFTKDDPEHSLFVTAAAYGSVAMLEQILETIPEIVESKLMFSSAFEKARLCKKENAQRFLQDWIDILFASQDNDKSKPVYPFSGASDSLAQVLQPIDVLPDVALPKPVLFPTGDKSFTSGTWAAVQHLALPPFGGAINDLNASNSLRRTLKIDSNIKTSFDKELKTKKEVRANTLLAFSPIASVVAATAPPDLTKSRVAAKTGKPNNNKRERDANEVVGNGEQKRKDQQKKAKH